jgi:uncharacterized protein YecT (DUF1311 family)
MKYLLLFCFSLFSFISNAQRELNKKDILKINSEIETEILNFKDSLRNSEKYLKPINLEFEIDIYKIEKLAEKKMNINFSTAGMSNAVFELEKGYDKLLNKYYKILIQKLNSKDAEKLKKTQENWIAFRDSERILVGIISKVEYSGGGTIQNNIRAAKICEITRKRVYEIKEYIDQIIE